MSWEEAGTLGRQESGQRNQYQAQDGSANDLHMPLGAQRLTTGEAGQVGQGVAERKWSLGSPQAGRLGRAVMLLVSKRLAMEKILPGPEDAALDLGMTAEGAGAGEEEERFGTHAIWGALPGPQAP